MLNNIKNLLSFLTFLVINFFFCRKKVNLKPNTLLLIRLDSIGDYVLFRNFIKILKEDEKYRNYKITLCGNKVFKDLAESLDSEFIDDFIWIDRDKFLHDIKYKIKILKLIHNTGFEIVINPTYTREILFGDQIVKSSNARVRIGCTGSPDKQKRIRIFTNKFYTELLNSSDNNYFEFYRNKEFFENLLRKKLNIQRTSLTVKGFSLKGIPGKDYIVLFPGASSKKRRWDISNYYVVANHIIGKFGMFVIVTGGEGEKELAGYFFKKPGGEKIIDYTGKTNLLQLAFLISNSKLLISNETGAVHIAAATGIPFICISNGQHYRRFHPYPEEIFSKGYYLYPKGFETNSSEFNGIAEKYRYGSRLNINSVSPLDVIKLCDQILL
jgi:ADP-heptose:LPS heptosyltransferase